MVQCRQLAPCFPSQVVHSLSKRDRGLYILFHIVLWTSAFAFFACLGVYAAERNYLYFILPLPCIILMFAGLFGFRWLAIRNNDKFQPRTPPHDAADAESGGRSAGDFPPPPPTYSTEYDGPIFTIFGSLAPPPSYDESAAVAAAGSVTSVTSATSAMTMLTIVMETAPPPYEDATPVATAAGGVCAA